MTQQLDTLWYTRCGVPTAVGIASHLGWLRDAFAPDGITVKSIRDSEDQRVRDSHFDHNLDNSIRQGGSSPAIWAKAAGRDTKVIGLIWTDESQQILTLPSSGIRTVKDLKGRRLALPQRSNERFPKLDIRRAAALRGYLAALQTEGLGAGDVEFVPLVRSEEEEGPFSRRDAPRNAFGYSFGDEVLALLKGRVDAIFVKDARGKALEAFLNAVEVIDVGRHPDPAVRVNYGVPRPLTIGAALLQDHPDVAERLLGLVIDAGQWAREHRRETIDIVAQEVGTPAHYVELAYPQLHEQLHTDLHEDWVFHFESYKNFLLAHGFLQKDVDVRAWVDPRPLQALLEKGHDAARRSRLVAAE
jgi:ABC-type nitrate/sulfonate/bicarbonate transport system substrate-binding protein